MKKLLLITLVTIIVTSCKNETKKEKAISTKVEKIAKTDNVKISIDLNYNVSDHLEIFYTLYDTEKIFTKEHSIKKEIIGMDEPQKIELELPKNAYPKKLRIDFGSNKKQKTIEINKIEITNKYHTILIDKYKFNDYFILGGGILTTDNHEFTMPTSNKNFDPHIISSASLNNQLLNM